MTVPGGDINCFKYFEKPTSSSTRCRKIKNILPFPRPLITMKCYTDRSLYNRLSVVTMTYHSLKSLHPSQNSKKSNKIEGVLKEFKSSYLVGDVKKIRDLRDTKIGLHDHLGRIISFKYRREPKIL